MLSCDEIDRLATWIASMDREELIQQFRQYPAPFKVDFDDRFLATQSVEKLRHVFFGLCLHTGRMPDEQLTAA